MDEMEQALCRALAAVGGPGAMGAALNITAQAVSQWKRVPPLRVLDVERVSGVPRGELRSDLYPVSEVAA